MRNFIFLTGFLISLGLSACRNEKVHEPFIENAGPPKQVINPEVKNFSGGATISYNLPKGSNALYIEAEYVVNKDKKMEVKTSFYDNAITVDGFVDTTVQEVKLFTVNRSEEKSDPVVVKVKPLAAPLWNVFNSLTMQVDFGGVSIDFENKDSASMAITVIAIDSSGQWEEGETFYTNQTKGSFKVRGYDSTERKFGVYVRDRWNNYSDTLIEKLKPFYEVELDKNNFKAIHFPNDGEGYGGGWPGQYPLAKIWNNSISDFCLITYRKVNGDYDVSIPISFTIDLGQEVKLSRYTLWQRQGKTQIYANNNARVLEVWGSNNPSSDGNWDSWTQIMTNEVIKPSGLPEGTVTAEDVEKAKEGDQYNFPIDTPPYRYLRFKLTTWGAYTHVYASGEISFWGAPQ